MFARKGTAKETSKQSNFQKSTVREEIAKKMVAAVAHMITM
ncbi:MAG TPA: hypothetical protein VI278_14815 [Nitrososphaeraceae archaeon]